MNNFRLFGMEGSKKFSKKVAQFLDVPLSSHVEYYFSDKEPYIRSDVNVRGCDVYIICSLYTEPGESVGEKFTKLLFFVGSLVDASARRITVITPYLSYARQDRKTESRAPISIKYFAQCLEAMGVNRVLTMDVHNLSAFQNAFRIPTDNLESKNLLADFLCGVDSGEENNGVPQLVEHSIPEPLMEMNEPLVVLAPDSGGMGRAKRFRYALEKRLKMVNNIDVVYLDKERLSGKKVRGSKIIGNVKKKQVIILDDLISSGSTVSVAAQAVEKHGGTVWGVCSTHGLFVGKVNKHLKHIKRVIVTDTIRPFRLASSKWKSRLFVIPTTRIFAQAIRRTHEEGGSISDLLK